MEHNAELLERAQVAFVRARIKLLQSKPFWAHLVLKLKLEWMEDVPGGVSCTDGEHIIINPEAFVKFSPEERVTILTHEAWHCVAHHLSRVGSRDPQKWNIAGDIYIANAQESEGFTLLRLQEVFFAQMGIQRSAFSGMATEQIYDKLKLPSQPKGGGKGKQGQGQPQPGQGQPQQGQGQGDGHQHWQGGGCYKPAQGSAKARELQQKWRQAVIEAGQQAGNLPGCCEELVKAAMPKPPFELALWEHLQRGIGGDTTWASVNRRYVHARQYLPTDTREVMGRVAWICDTSGSMGQDQLKLAFGYFRAFREEHPCVADLICCDYDVASHKTFEEHEELPDKFAARGRGGTSFDAPFKMIGEKRLDPTVAIYITDGYGSCTAPKPQYAVLWVVVGDLNEFKPPFGQVVYARQHGQ